MTLEELDQRFPNGLDDADITSILVDYEQCAATFHLNLRSNSPDSSDRDVYSPAILRMTGLYYLSIEPPDLEHLDRLSRRKVTVAGSSEGPNTFPQFNEIKSRLTSNSFCCRFFVHDWNSFIHVGAADAELRLVGC